LSFARLSLTAIVPLEGVVEYKSLPSGLHNVEEDLVYFHHEAYAGVSAFVKGTASEAERNAQFVSVGAMLRLKDGRLGRAWLHAHNLQNLAKSVCLHPEELC
jgi:DENN domain-containing protein 11